MWDSRKTALIIIDPYNDFLSFPGKSWLLNRATLNALGTNQNLVKALELARSISMTVCYAPHARHHKGVYDQRRFFNPSSYLAEWFRTFRRGGWGGAFRKGLEPQEDEFVASEHLISSGFVGTDLHEHLQSKSVTHLVLCGCLSNTCVESTARSAIEYGYHVTILSDALAAMSLRDHEAAIVSGFRMCAHELTTVDAFATALQS